MCPDPATNPMRTLTIVLFGRPQFVVDGAAASRFNTRKDCALLAYLAVTGGAHSREHLAGLLWSDLPEDKARRNLRHTLSHLQKVIGPAWIETAGSVALTRSLPWTVDVQQLQLAVDAVAAPSGQEPHQRDQAAMDALDQALVGYRAEFLHGFYVQKAAVFDEWVLARRAEYHLLAVRGLEIAAQHALAQGDAVKGLAATRRLLTLEPWSETAHRLQMQLLVASGQRAAALAQYETCRRLLAAELGVEPMAETTALYQQIQAGSYSAPATRRRPDPPLAPSVVPPPAIRPTIQHNLFAPLAGFVGRQAELELIGRRLGAPDCRLMTIVGPGGMGKTSLALAAGQRLLGSTAADFPDGIFFVPLLDVGVAEWNRSDRERADDAVSGEAILRAIAEQIGYKLEAGGSPAAQLRSYVRARRLLLILDNFEHLLAGTNAFVALLTAAPQLKALVTSRARLNVRGETILALGKLSLPDVGLEAGLEDTQAGSTYAITDASWQASDAVAMFVQRAQQLDPAFAIDAATIGPVGRICQLVEGLPLGIELATSMLPLLSCDALAEALAGSLEVLAADTRDLPPAQRTLGAVFERSWRLLPPDAQQLLAGLAIFPGSFHREAAERIAGAASWLLLRLLDQSLLGRAGSERYAMHRTVHAFAQQKLEQRPEQSAALQVGYARFYLKFLARLGQLTGAAYVAATEQIQADLDNVRTAWRWSVEQGDLALLELGVGSLQDFYRTAGIYPEAIQLLEVALPVVRQAVARAPTAAQPQRVLARLLCYTAQFYRLYRRAGQGQKAEAYAKETLELGRRLADAELQALACHELARLAQTRVDFAAMCALSEQAVRHARQANLSHLAAESLNDLGIGVGVYTHPLASAQHFLEALECLREQPNRALEGRILSNLGLFHLVGHHYQLAHRYLQQRLTVQQLLREQDDRLLTLICLGDLWTALGVFAEAQEVYAQSQTLVQARQAPYWESWLHVGYARLQRLRGDTAAAHTTCQRAVQVAQEDGGPTEQQWALIELGHILASLGDRVAAGQCYQQAIALPKTANWFFRTPDAHAGLAALALAQNDVAAAMTHVETALALLGQQGLAAAGEPFAVYWTCVFALESAGDVRARTVLVAAYQALCDTANQLEDLNMRRSFLENLAVNCQLLAAAQAAGIA